MEREPSFNNLIKSGTNLQIKRLFDKKIFLSLFINRDVTKKQMDRLRGVSFKNQDYNPTALLSSR